MRNGPNPIRPPNPATHHWFVGTGMVHGVRLEGGRARWYRNRWIRGHEVSQALREPPAPGTRTEGFDAPNTNVEMIVARLIQFGKLGGFHFNDSQYGDDDLDAGSLKPFQLFLVFNELVDAFDEGVPGFDPCYLLDQSCVDTVPIFYNGITSAPRVNPGVVAPEIQPVAAAEQLWEGLVGGWLPVVRFVYPVSERVSWETLTFGVVDPPTALAQSAWYRFLRLEDKRHH